jgi:hypothetical protein
MIRIVEDLLELDGSLLQAGEAPQVISAFADVESKKKSTTQLRLVNISFDELDSTVAEAIQTLVGSQKWKRIVVAYCRGRLSDSLIQRILCTQRFELYGSSSLNLFPAIGKELESHTSSITCLKLRSRFNQDTMAPLATGIAAATKTLDEVYFTAEFTDSESVLALARGLRSNQHLKALSFYSCEMFDEDSMEELLHALTDHPTLATLELRDNSCFGMAALAALVRSTKHIKKLDLYHPPHTINELQVPRLNMESLALALQENRSLLSLCLSNNALHDASAAWLAMALRVNTTLEVLDLQGNLISDEGIEALAAALPEIRLKKLFLWNNPFSGKGATLIRDGMRSNHVLEEISTFSKILCTDEIQFYAHLNKAGKSKILQASNRVPFSLWPVILDRVNQQDWSVREVADVHYCLLREGPVLLTPR